MIQTGTEVAIIVDKVWSYATAVRRFLGPSERGTTQLEGNPRDGSIITAKVLDSSDHHGLWIELNSEKKKWPDLPEFRMMIPWHVIMSVIVNPELLPSDSNKIGFVQPPDKEGTDVTKQKGE